MPVWRAFKRLSRPAAGLVLVAAAAGSALTRAEVPAPRAVAVEMIARRFAFAPELVEAVEGDDVTIHVRSADGTHGFEIEKLKVRQAIPRGGNVVTLSFTAPAPGRYAITCSEYCGRGHDDMKSVLVVAPRTR